MIFQEPMTALDPMYTIEDQIVESLRFHTALSRSAMREAALEMLRKVKIPRAEEILKDNEVGSLASDPDKVGDIIVYVKGLFDSNQITDDEISQGIDEAADHFGVSLNEDDKSSLVNIISKFRGIEMSDDQIKGYVSDAYSTLKDMGVTKSDVKNIFEKAIEFIKGMLSRR